MGVRILVDKDNGEACFYQSTSMWAFGPVMNDEETAVDFLEWSEEHGIRLAMIPENEVEKIYYDFIKERDEKIEKEAK